MNKKKLPFATRKIQAAFAPSVPVRPAGAPNSVDMARVDQYMGRDMGTIESILSGTDRAALVTLRGDVNTAMARLSAEPPEMDAARAEASRTLYAIMQDLLANIDSKIGYLDSRVSPAPSREDAYRVVELHLSLVGGTIAGLLATTNRSKMLELREHLANTARLIDPLQTTLTDAFRVTIEDLDARIAALPAAPGEPIGHPPVSDLVEAARRAVGTDNLGPLTENELRYLAALPQPQAQQEWRRIAQIKYCNVPPNSTAQDLRTWYATHPWCSPPPPSQPSTGFGWGALLVVAALGTAAVVVVRRRRRKVGVR